MASILWKPGMPGQFRKRNLSGPRGALQSGGQHSTPIHILLEMVAATVRHDAAVDDMDLPDRPAVEPRFREKLFQERMVTNLHVAGAQTQPLDQRLRRDRSIVAMVKYPGDGGRI